MTDLIIFNARIRTMSRGEETDFSAASAVAISNGEITHLGSDEEILGHAQSQTEVIDAKSAVLTPGLIDSHMHPVWGAELTEGIDLGGLTNLDQVKEAIAAGAASLGPTEWVRGWNLDYKAFPDGIDGSLLDQAGGGRPTALLFYDLHTAVGNQAALEAAGITGDEQFSDTSQIVADAQGRLTGELREMPAYMLLLDAAPRLEQAEIVDRIEDILMTAAASGVTSAAVMDGRDTTLELLDALESRQSGLPVRLHIAMWHQPSDDDRMVDHRIGLLGKTGQRYKVSMIKMFIDGVIDSGTAWLHQPDSLGSSTQPFWKSLDRYAEVAAAYHHAGFQLATHSCGDAGAAAAMKVYADLGGPAANGAHHRVEHLETLTDEDIEQLSTTGTVASMQPLHMQWREGDHSDQWASRLGQHRTARAFRTKDILEAGASLALGSDWPVAELDARIGMAWTRLRREPGNLQAPVFETTQRLTGTEALLGYTRWAAEGLGRYDLGRIAAGMRADLALWEQDPVATDSDALLNVKVRLTIVEGTIVHSKENGR